MGKSQFATSAVFTRVSNNESAVRLDIYDDIVHDDFWGGVTAQGFQRDLTALGDVSQINVHINSDGGDVFHGLSIYRNLLAHPARVTVHVDGVAASIATVIMMAGDEIQMAQASMMFVHEPETFVAGRAGLMRETAGTLEVIQSQIVDVYNARTGIAKEDLHAYMSKDPGTWFTAAEAVELGFADAISPNAAIAAKVSDRYEPPSALLVDNESPSPGNLSLLRAKRQRARRA